MKIRMSQLREKWAQLLLLGVIFTSSMYLFESFSGLIRLLALLVLSFVMFYLYGKRFKATNVGICLCFVMLIVASVMINGIEFLLDLGAVIGILAALLITSAFSKQKFIETYNSVMIFLALFSLFTYFLFLIAPGIVYMFPIRTWRNGTTNFANMLLSVVPVSMRDYYRNFGMFYEPGIYQIFLNIALVFELFYRKTNFKRVIILCVTVITTLSTNGYISCALILFAYWLKLVAQTKDPQTRKRRNRFTILAVIGVVAVIAAYFAGIIDQRIFAKFTTTKDAGSTFDRVNAISYAINKFLQNPLLGVGHANLQDAHVVTFTPLNWFMLYGFFFGVMSNLLFCAFVFDIHANKVVKSVLAFAFLSTILTQNMAREWIVWCIIFYGVASLKKTVRID